MQHSDWEGPRGIGGWLILVIAGLIISLSQVGYYLKHRRRSGLDTVFPKFPACRSHLCELTSGRLG